MWFIKTHETVNCNSTLRQQCFLSSFSSAQLLPCSGISNLTRVGWLLQLLGWPFITCFFRIDGLWRVFVWLWLNFFCQSRIKPFFPSLFLLCSALSRPSWLLQLFWDPWAAFLLGLLQASLLVFLFASSLAWLHFFIERVALWLWLSFWCQCRIIVY